MKKIQWSNDMSIGVELVDEQHKMLIQHLHDLTNAIESHHSVNQIVKTLDFLIEYTNFHFSEEEKHMSETNYPGLEHQKIKHEEFKTTLNDLVEYFNEDGATHQLADSIDTLLINWLIKHICVVDLEFGTFLKEKGIEITE